MKQIYTSMIMNKNIHCAGLLANQKHTKLVSILQLDCSTTCQKAANFHLLQKTISRYKLPMWCMCIDICTLCSRLLWCFTKHLRAQPHQIRSWNYDMISDPEFITKIFKGEEFSWKEVLVLNFLSNKDENFHLFTKFHCLIFLKKVSRPFSY